jgi:hypothetical protein
MVNIGGANSSTFTINATALSDNGAKFRCVVTNSFGTATSNEATLTVNAPPPIVITEQSTDVAIALESVWMTRDPFPFTTLLNLSTDQRTRLIFFVKNLDLLSTENVFAVTVRAEDVQMNIYFLTVEHVSKPAGFDFSEVIVRLPDNLPTGQNFFVSVSFRGQASNKARITMR